MISDEDILLHLDEIIANEDEFIDDINFDIENNDIEVTELEVTDPPSPDHSPIVQRNFRPKEHYFDSSKCGVQKHEFGLNSNSSKLEFFKAFVSEFLLGKVAFETNRYAKQYIQSNEISHQSRVNAWKDTNVDEMYTFLATTILMSRNKKLDMKDYWSTDPLLSSPIFRQIISRNRYLLLHQMLHFCNNENQEKGNRLFKLDVVLDEIRTNFKAGMVPFQNIVIDESLVLWKGRLSFKQFIKTKRHRFGIKFFVLCDVETDFILDFIIYTGTETRLLPYDANIGISGAVVKTLIAPYLNKGYNLYTDNWYTSPILAQYLYKKKTTITGTVRKNRRGMPELKNKLAVGDVQSAHSKNIMVLKWVDRREVFMLSTKFDSNLDNSGNILNAFSAFKTVTGQNMPLANFQLEVIRQLLEKYGGNTVSPRGRPCTKDQPFRLSARHFPSDVKKLASGKVQRRKCIVCTRNNKRKDTMYMCQECDVGLCATPCFAIYHTKQNYLAKPLYA
ncbi:piggyBac transposable element-derived protein 4-like [Acyrthosiphon pisum]|uniref:PiggyBac transposable element-derived protein 4-like n=1 Tax=Acyrthosiphon pisum TaxID=7029 RepID=A0A8R2F6T6_ACYPI|nr:piggyBac transposable element-derived protein 4-like [Acyrthosiphon pisum]|eukprot:XP_008181189.1 PREDICTED: piggyBac transposable element-derived protein 4-like [Acyrthosiphon pisum]